MKRILAKVREYGVELSFTKLVRLQFNTRWPSRCWRTRKLAVSSSRATRFGTRRLSPNCCRRSQCSSSLCVCIYVCDRRLRYRGDFMTTICKDRQRFALTCDYHSYNNHYRNTVTVCRRPCRCIRACASLTPVLTVSLNLSILSCLLLFRLCALVRRLCTLLQVAIV